MTPVDAARAALSVLFILVPLAGAPASAAGGGVDIGAVRCNPSPISGPRPASLRRALRYLEHSAHARRVLASLTCHQPAVTVLERSGRDMYVGDGVVIWDPHEALRTTSGGRLSPALCLLHELGHAASVDDESGALTLLRDRGYDDVEERRVIEEIEAPAARELGESVRHDHGGTLYFVKGPLDR